ncbi:flagellar basal-body rod protein FlgG [Motiliproteus sp. MSK22-1]|uniref:flagellar basal-body rod protein FlgG n=1 Tax=Motiliproteus sp. MSK22-1 TaxID=1897630 RepID=UPI0009780E39|nr:flagellar basal-body rod protein FlgG [Motiliproteus sp. MSK22-1]OMH30006.1 flagellar basal-body rod protein FlgG [Motiliproteus sp. MSK22-1]
MNSALFIAKTGLSAQETALQVVSNNLANVNTDGFKRDRAVFEDLLYQVQRQPGAQSSDSTELPSGFQLGNGVKIVGTQKLHTQGGFKVTEQELDVAIEGKGFFQVTLPDGSSGYTRNGNFQLNSIGQMVTSEGYELQGVTPIPSDALNLTISRQGEVTYGQPGSTTLLSAGTISMANFINPAGLQALGGNVFIETPASGAPVVGAPRDEGIGGTIQGALETSNVNSVEELVDMITVQRAFEMNSKVISTADQMLSFVTQQL